MDEEIQTQSFSSRALLNSDEELFEIGLRPSKLAEFVGLENIKKPLEIMIQSALMRGKPLDHILFYGPPGLGKTSLALALANEMGSRIISTSGPALAKPGDLAAILTSLPENAILFIDEIHRLRQPLEELLYSAMEDRNLDLVVGKGAGAKSLKIDLPPFTLIGATTKPAMLSAPLRSRFGAEFRLNFYSVKDLSEIITSKSNKIDVRITQDVSDRLAARARMTARIAVRLVRRLKDWSVVAKADTLTASEVDSMLETLGIDELGLDDLDRRILATLYYKFNNKPIGLNTIAASLAEDKDTIDTVCEPYLLQLGLLERSPRGRVLTQKAVKYIEENPKLFLHL